jgi:hypothetical protein
MLRHRDAWAEERRSPTAGEWARQQQQANAKEKRLLKGSRGSSRS